MKMIPAISVVLPVYNAERFVKEAIDSVLKQTFSDFELIVIDDGSSDSSVNIVKSFSDDRIVLVSNEVNKGLIYSLNLGLQMARGKYIVRMDADDVCFADRFQKQFDFMEVNPGVAVCGGQMEDYDGVKKINNVEINSPKLKASLLFTCVLSHPTVIMRSESIKSGNFLYDSRFPHSEDYELWSRIARKFKIANISDVILKYRFHPQQVSRVYSEVQIEGMKQCQKNQFDYIGLSVSNEELNLHSRISCLDFEMSEAFFVATQNWLSKLLDSPNIKEHYAHYSIKSVVGDWYYNICGELLNAKISIKKNILISPLTYRCLDISRLTKLLIKVVVK
jgi:glycosyltransferase involved in cell wall biosynthesis